MTIEQLKRSNPKTGVVVHIDEHLDEQHRQHIQYIVEQVDGVTHAHFNEIRNHLLIVGYDRQRTSSAEILNRVKRQHLHAQLV